MAMARWLALALAAGAAADVNESSALGHGQLGVRSYDQRTIKPLLVTMKWWLRDAKGVISGHYD